MKKRWTDKRGKAPTDDDAERIYLKVISVALSKAPSSPPSPPSWTWSWSSPPLHHHHEHEHQNCISSHWRRPLTCFPPTRSWSAAFLRFDLHSSSWCWWEDNRLAFWDSCWQSWSLMRMKMIIKFGIQWYINWYFDRQWPNCDLSLGWKLVQAPDTPVRSWQSWGDCNLSS